MSEQQLSRVLSSLLRLITEVMIDLVNQDGTTGEEESDDSDQHIRRSVSAPVLLTPPVGLLMSRKWRTLTRSRNAGPPQATSSFILTPLRSLVISRPTDSIAKALICAYTGSTLEPIWTWLAEGLDRLEVSLRRRRNWILRRPELTPLEFIDGRSKLPKDLAAQQQPTQNQPPSASAILIGANEGDGPIVAIGSAESSAPIKDAGNRAHALRYLNNLMRSAENEYGSQVDVVDISIYRHAAFILDALVFLFKVSCLVLFSFISVLDIG